MLVRTNPEVFALSRSGILWTLLFCICLASCDRFQTLEVLNRPLEERVVLESIEGRGKGKVLKATFHIFDDQIRLIRMKPVQDNPSLFLETTETSAYLIKVFSKDEKVLFSGGLKDPLLVRYEREDSKKPGVWEHLELHLKETVFDLKIPLPEGSQDVHFYKPIDADGLKELLHFEVGDQARKILQ